MRKFRGLVLFSFIISLSGHAWAANYSDPIDGLFKGIYGNTIAIEVPSLVSKSPVYKEDQNGDLSFQLNSSTTYRNFDHLTDLKYGDPVRIEYTQDSSTKEKQMAASVITKLDTEVVAGAVENTTVAAPVPAAQTVTTTTTTQINSP